MSDDQVTEFRESNNKIVVTNFNPDSADIILKPTPAFHHAFHNHPGILETISGNSWNFLTSWRLGSRDNSLSDISHKLFFFHKLFFGSSTFTFFIMT